MKTIFLCVLLLGNGRIDFVRESMQEINFCSCLVSKFLSPVVMLCQNYRPLKTRCYNRKCQSSLTIDWVNNPAYDAKYCKKEKREKERKTRFYK